LEIFIIRCKTSIICYI